MSKFEKLDEILNINNGYLTTAEATRAGVSRTYLGEFVRERGLERVAQGLYRSTDAWEDGMYVLQVRYPLAVFSHETALYLLNLAEREPDRYSVTLKAGSNTSGLVRQGVKVYKVKKELFEEGVEEARSPAGHLVRVYSPERTICDVVRNRSSIEIQDLQSAIKRYVKKKDKNLPLLMRYAKAFSVERIIRGYLEVLLS